MPKLDQLPPSGEDKRCVRVVVETTRRTRTKFKFEPKLGAFALSKLLPAGMYFPHDFGFVPSTAGDDGDPLDVLVFADEPLSVGCVVEVRLIGVIEAEQTEEGQTIRNDRLLGIEANSRELAQVRSVGELPSQSLDEIEAFFVAYNRGEGREFEILARKGPRAAERLLDSAVRAFRAKHRRKRAS